MNIPFLDNWRKQRERENAALSDVFLHDPEGAVEILSECQSLREQADAAGVELDDTPDSLAALDQLLPRWREDPEVCQWLGSDAGLYLGTVIVRAAPGAQWRLSEAGQPVVRLSSGRELDVLEYGDAWARTGAPELSQLYGEASEG